MPNIINSIIEFQFIGGGEIVLKREKVFKSYLMKKSRVFLYSAKTVLVIHIFK